MKDLTGEQNNRLEELIAEIGRLTEEVPSLTGKPKELTRNAEQIVAICKEGLNIYLSIEDWVGVSKMAYLLYQAECRMKSFELMAAIVAGAAAKNN